MALLDGESRQFMRIHFSRAPDFAVFFVIPYPPRAPGDRRDGNRVRLAWLE
jgi:hypothetical protein